MNREFSYIDAIEMSTYFENYDGMDNDFHLKQEFKDKLKKAAKILAGTGALVGLAIAFGPGLLSAATPVMEAIKKYLAATGVDTKGMGAGEKLKTFYEKVFKEKADTKDKDGPKKIVEKILKFFKDLKEKKDKGQLTDLEKMLLDTANKTVSDIDSGKVNPEDLITDTTGSKDTGKKTKAGVDGVEVTTKVDTKTIFIAVAALVALMYFSKK